MTINLQTQIRLPRPPKELLCYGNKLMSLGSCFSQHIGDYLTKLGHHITVNPFGIVYNPASIAEILSRLLDGQAFTVEDLFIYNDLYHSRLHHGAYSSYNLEKCLERINEDYKQAREVLYNLDYLLLTWGSAWVYEDELGVVTNCHKRPESNFQRRLWTPTELQNKIEPLLKELLKDNPKLQIITTISPIRHLRDTAHGNQLSKATLLLMNEALAKSLGRERYHYFPSYEILLDELRDYRFYAEDMIHPSELTQKIIAERLASWLIDEDAQQVGKQVLRLKAQLNHRPLHPEHPESELRAEQLALLRSRFQEQYPLVKW